jgi:hypothetical protein
LLLLFNVRGGPVTFTFTLPAERPGKPWEIVLDTATGGIGTEFPRLHVRAGSGADAQIPARSAELQVGASPM